MLSEEEQKTSMFRNYVNQPIHKTLTQLRVVSITLICFGMWLLHDMWQWFKSQESLPNGWDVAFWGFAAAVLGIIWKAVQHIQDKHDKDEYDL